MPDVATSDGDDGSAIILEPRSACGAQQVEVQEGAEKKIAISASMVAGTATTTAMGRLVRSARCACLLAAPAAGVALPHGAIVPRVADGAAHHQRLFAHAPASMVATVPDVPDAFDFDTLGERLDTSPIGVLLLSVGSPETKEDVEEYLYNVFCDRILTLPPAFSWALKQPIAAFIAKTEAPAAREIMESVGGLSPQKATIDQQALALKQELANRGVSSKQYVAMRYWTPFADEAVEQMKADGIQKLVILPLYPQFSLSTSGSSLRVLERMLYTDPGFPMESTVVPAWYNRRGFLRATARAVAEALAALPDGGEGAHVLYSAQGLPRVYVEELGDPYEEQVRRTVELVTAQLAELGHAPKNTLSFQGQFGPQRVAWLGPSTSEVIGQLGADGVRTLVVVPISFVFEHMGTLNEIDREYASTAKQAGITTFVRVPTLGTDPSFIDTLASVVVEALPDLSRPSMQQINEGNPVSLSIVNECADDATRRNFPAELCV